MDDKTLKKISAVFRDEFQEDLKCLEKTSDSTIDAMIEWINDLGDFQKFNNMDSWLPFIGQKGLLFNELKSTLTVTVYIINTCIDLNITVEEFFSELAELKLLDSFSKREEIKSKIIKLYQILNPKLIEKAKRSSPTIPLLYIDGVEARCIFITEFESQTETDEFDLSNYSPALKAMFPRITLGISFNSDDQQDIGILLTPSSLKLLKGALEKSEVELKTAMENLSLDYVSPWEDVK